MRYALFAGVVSLGVLVASAQAQESYKNEITVSAFGVFEQSTTGNGVSQSAQEQPGALGTYRYYVTDHQGLEFDYAFSRFNQQYNRIGATALSLTGIGLGGTSLTVPANMNEGTVSYVYRFGALHRLRPFLSAGGGVLVFSPDAVFGSASGNTFVTPDIVYTGGADVPLSRRVSLRVGYRAHLFEAPAFGIGAIKTGSVAYMSEPFAGLSFHF